MFKTAEQRQETKQEKQQARDDRAFWASPVGQARKAYVDGDRYFQVEIPHSKVKGMVAFGGTTSRVSHAHGGTDVLGAIAAEGWELLNSGWVYVMKGQESRDKMLASGQQTVTLGEVIGIYLFERV